MSGSTAQFGVDISSLQQITSYAKLKAHVDFAYIRVYRSNGAEDLMWKAHFLGLVGTRRAPYMFLRPRQELSPTIQVNNFLRMLANRYCPLASWEWGPVIDAEFTTEQRAVVGPPDPQLLRDTIDRLRFMTGRRDIWVYAGQRDLAGPLTPDTFADPHVHIIAARYVANDQPHAWANLALPADPRIQLTQYWNNGFVVGIAGPVDLNTGIITKGPIVSTGATWDVLDQQRGIASTILPVGTASQILSEAWISWAAQFGAGRPIGDVQITYMDDTGHVLAQQTGETAEFNHRKYLPVLSGTTQITLSWRPNTALDDRGPEVLVPGLEVMPK